MGRPKDRNPAWVYISDTFRAVGQTFSGMGKSSGCMSQRSASLWWAVVCEGKTLRRDYFTILHRAVILV